MTKLSEHFTLEEFTRSSTADAHGIPNTPTTEHQKNLEHTAAGFERIRSSLGSAVVISSGYRNPEVNELVGGVPTSDHALGYAGDWSCPDFGTPYQCAVHIQDDIGDFDQIIIERKSGSWWVHTSFNPRNRKELLTLSEINPNHYTSGLHDIVAK